MLVLPAPVPSLRFAESAMPLVCVSRLPAVLFAAVTAPAIVFAASSMRRFPNGFFSALLLMFPPWSVHSIYAAATTAVSAFAAVHKLPAVSLTGSSGSASPAKQLPAVFWHAGTAVPKRSAVSALPDADAPESRKPDTLPLPATVLQDCLPCSERTAVPSHRISASLPDNTAGGLAVPAVPIRHNLPPPAEPLQTAAATAAKPATPAVSAPFLSWCSPIPLNSLHALLLLFAALHKLAGSVRALPFSEPAPAGVAGSASVRSTIPFAGLPNADIPARSVPAVPLHPAIRESVRH